MLHNTRQAMYVSSLCIDFDARLLGRTPDEVSADLNDLLMVLQGSLHGHGEALPLFCVSSQYRDVLRYSMRSVVTTRLVYGSEDLLHKACRFLESWGYYVEVVESDLDLIPILL